jgi:DUF4097 and DUF4098 domain-containing protein YvlB
VVECEAGAVDIACQAVSVTEVTLEADSPGGIDLIEGAVVACSASTDGHLLSVRIPPQHLRGRQRHGEVQVRIVVPLGTDVDVTTASAPIQVHGLVGRATFKTASGSIVGDDAAGSIRAKSASGSIALGSVEGDVRIGAASRRAVLSTISGAIEVAAAAADLEAKTTSGRIDLGALHADAGASTVSGNIRVASQHGGRLQIRTVSGDVSVGIAEKVTLRVDVDSVSGRIRSEIPIGDALARREAVPMVSVVARTVSGDVTLERAAVPALHE